MVEGLWLIDRRRAGGRGSCRAAIGNRRFGIVGLGLRTLIDIRLPIRQTGTVNHQQPLKHNRFHDGDRSQGAVGTFLFPYFGPRLRLVSLTAEVLL